MSDFEGYPNTYELVTANGQPGIKCLHCDMVSHNPNDIEQHYCGFCHTHHDDIPPLSRHWWITHKAEPKVGRWL